MRISDWSSDVCSSDLRSSATRPPLISVFSRSRERLGSASASARSSRSPAAPTPSVTVKISSSPCIGEDVVLGRGNSRGFALALGGALALGTGQAGNVRNLRWGAHSSMTDDRVDFASMLASRLCHDLLSPVGAFANGLELLADEKDPEMRARCIDLLEQTARTSANKLKFFRLAFGSAGGFGELVRSEEHTSELQSLMRISYAVFCLKKKIHNN